MFAHVCNVSFIPATNHQKEEKTAACDGAVKSKHTKRKGLQMAKMCKLGSSCSAHKGMCIHEKIMAGMMVVAMVGGLVYWLA